MVANLLEPCFELREVLSQPSTKLSSKKVAIWSWTTSRTLSSPWEVQAHLCLGISNMIAKPPTP
eukprot:6225635-Amphidinium_carterae.1